MLAMSHQNDDWHSVNVVEFQVILSSIVVIWNLPIFYFQNAGWNSKVWLYRFRIMLEVIQGYCRGGIASHCVALFLQLLCFRVFFRSIIITPQINVLINLLIVILSQKPISSHNILIIHLITMNSVYINQPTRST